MLSYMSTSTTSDSTGIFTLHLDGAPIGIFYQVERGTWMVRLTGGTARRVNGTRAAAVKALLEGAGA